MTQQSGDSSVICEIPPFTIDDNTEEIHRDKLRAYFANLTTKAITDQIITDFIKMVKSLSFCTSIMVTNLAKEVFPKHIVKDGKL